MADDTVYVISQGSRESGLRSDADGNPPNVKTYVYDDGEWTLCESNTEELAAVELHFSDEDLKFVALLVPYSAITFDADDKITNVILP